LTYWFYCGRGVTVTMALVLNPALPYKANLSRNLTTGTVIHVKGTVNPDAGRAAVNFITEDGDNAFHFNPRFGDDLVVLNTKTSGSWGSEDRVPCLALQRGQEFDLKILAESDMFMVRLNGEHYCHYPHRLKAKKVNRIEVHGDLQVSLVHETSAFVSAAPRVNPSVPFTTFIPGAFTADKIIMVYGVATGDTFSVNLQCGPEPFKDIALHFNPRVSAGQIVLNDCVDGAWGPEQVCDYALHPGWAFAMEIVCHDGTYEIHLNGTEVAHFEHRNTHVHPIHLVDTLHICGDVEIHQLRI